MMRGELQKRSQFLHTWKTRRFELDTGLLVRTLRYYDSHGKLKGELVLNGKRCIIQLLAEGQSGKPHSFVLTAGGRALILAASSDSTMRKWIDFLQQNGVTLLGAEEVEQQKLWRSVMEAERQMNTQERQASSTLLNTATPQNHFAYSRQQSVASDGPRFRGRGFSEGTTRHSEIVASSEDDEDEAVDGLLNSEIELGNRPTMTKMDFMSMQVQNGMVNLGMIPEYIPHDSAKSKCQVFLSEDWQTCDKIIIFIGNGGGSRGGVPCGIWSRSGCSTLGISAGSMLDYLKQSQVGGYGSIVLDTSTHTNLVEVDGELRKVPIQGSETAERHIATIWERFISQAAAESLFVISYGYGGECFKEFLESNTSLLFSSKTPCLKALAFLDSSHCNDGITQDSVRRFLRQRSINWLEDSAALRKKTVKEHEHYIGCRCIPVDTRSSKLTGSSNRAWIIPVVKDAVFRFLDFCVDADANVGNVGMYYSDRWVSMEIQMLQRLGRESSLGLTETSDEYDYSD